jgi:hypothetical protein
MKPCDVKTYGDYNDLEAAGVAFDQNKIEIDTYGVFLMVEPHCRIKFSRKVFREFARWYLEDQAK